MLTEDIIVDIIRTYFIIICTYYMNLKLINRKMKYKYVFILCVVTIIITLISIILKKMYGFFYSIIFNIIVISFIFSIHNKNNFISSLIVTVISLCINYILFSISILISYILNKITKIKNEYINISIIILLDMGIIHYFLKNTKIKKGLLFLHEKLKEGYFEILILNISVIILFTIIILSNYDKLVSRSFWLGLVVSSIIMFITIQKSLQLYYKQKMLIQDLNETKAELEQKNEEIKQLEQDNLNFSKKSHSIAHKQKALEHKLNKIMKNAEIVEENDMKNRINEISQEIINTDTTNKLTKTNIQNIDDMLEYMKSECVKNKIEFELQLNGNIYYMVNNFVSKEDLEILLADHIKDAIIAINYSDNVNKSILIRLGIIDGIYSLYIYDSGIEFEIDTLKNLGKKPSTTHADSGGTGMGFMNTFDTLNKYKASMIIEEYGKPSRDNYTKAIMIKFDKNNEFKICSYRDEQVNYAKL